MYPLAEKHFKLNNKLKNDKYDLEERTAKFGERIIKFAQKIPKDVISIPLISQLVRAGTSGFRHYKLSQYVPN